MIILKKICCNCQSKLEGGFGRIDIIYKYCPYCGTYNNVHLRTEKHGFIYRWSMELIYLLYFIIVVAIMGKGIAILAFLMTAIAYLGIGLLYKPCRHCSTITCKRPHDYCHNCGQSFQSTIKKYLGKL
jgi:hypothetical protein